MKVDISVVIPAYNEELLIADTVKNIAKYLTDNKYTWEIIVVNDGSKDRTEEILKELSHKINQLKIIKHKINEGKGKSVKDGIFLSEGRVILFTDADLSAPMENLKGMKEELDKGSDIVVASRLAEGAKIKKRPLHRKIIGRMFNIIIGVIGFRGVKDTQCGFKLFKSDVAKEIFKKSRINGYAFDVEILHIAKIRGFKIKEYPVLWIDREDSKMKIIRDAFRMLREVLKIKYYDKKGLYK
ncbi:MAG: glycosyltransferase family 2 protein [Proteobacteria bacterium]|nr:glycosyltransferase family 2 protein [Pseudomonadota bacterium]